MLQSAGGLGRGLLLFFRNKFHRNRVDAVAGVFFGQAFADKNMAEVAAAIGAEYLGAPPVGVCFFAYRTGYFVIESRPTAAGVELVGRAVQRRFAPPADVFACGKMLVVLARKWALCAFVFDDPFFFRAELVPAFFWLVFHFSMVHQNSKKVASILMQSLVN